MSRGLADYLILISLLVMASWVGATWYGLADVGWPIWILLAAGTLYMLGIGALNMLLYLNEIVRSGRW